MRSFPVVTAVNTATPGDRRVPTPRSMPRPGHRPRHRPDVDGRGIGIHCAAPLLLTADGNPGWLPQRRHVRALCAATRSEPAAGSDSVTASTPGGDRAAVERLLS